MSRAWLFQDGRQKAKLGPKACPWSVGYFDDEGRRKSKRIGSKSAATKYARKVEGELASGTYQSTRNKNWPEFRVEYLERGLAGCAPRSVESAKLALGQFEKLIKPVRVNTITSRTIADYVSKRLAPRISKDDKERPPLSPATINRELRTLRAALRRANRWGPPRVPHFDFLKVPGRLPTFVSAEHFSKLYEHAGAARWPNEGPYTTADWWQALFVMAYMTGWRISSLLALKWADVDLENGFALSRAEDNKGKPTSGYRCIRWWSITYASWFASRPRFSPGSTQNGRCSPSSTKSRKPLAFGQRGASPTTAFTIFGGRLRP